MATVRETHLSSGNHNAIGQTEQIELSGFGRASHVRFDRFCSILWVGGRRASVVQIAERRAAERIHAAFFCVLERSYLASSGRRIIGGSCADDLLQRPEGQRRFPVPRSEIPCSSIRSSLFLDRKGRIYRRRRIVERVPGPDPSLGSNAGAPRALGAASRADAAAFLQGRPPPSTNSGAASASVGRRRPLKGAPDISWTTDNISDNYFAKIGNQCYLMPVA